MSDFEWTSPLTAEKKVALTGYKETMVLPKNWTGS
jgi:hypothetical protein